MNAQKTTAILLILLILEMLPAGCTSQNSDVPAVGTQKQMVTTPVFLTTSTTSSDALARKMERTIVVPVSTTQATAENCSPVANATIGSYLVTSAGETKIAESVTDSDGSFSFTATSEQHAASYRFKLIIAAPGILLGPGETNILVFDENAADGPVYSYTLLWCPSQEKAQNRGSFAVSGKSDAKFRALVPVNNYGINDEGIK